MLHYVGVLASIAVDIAHSNNPIIVSIKVVLELVICGAVIRPFSLSMRA